jgi:hypothetical protein
MTHTRLALGTLTLALAGGVAAFAAQHVKPTPQASHAELFAGLHGACASTTAAAGAAATHVPAHFSQMLELTPAQTADIDRLAAEACQVMTRTHEAIQNVLTAEQRARIAAMHGEGHTAATGIHAFFRKLHGGK